MFSAFNLNTDVILELSINISSIFKLLIDIIPLFVLIIVFLEKHFFLPGVLGNGEAPFILNILVINTRKVVNTIVIGM